VKGYNHRAMASASDPRRSSTLSVVVPAYDEGARLAPSLRRILDHLRARELDFEVLVVDDGSRDDTAEVARSFDSPEVVVLRHLVNRGKGAALRTGVLASRGDRVLLTDADLSTPITDLERLEPHLEQADLVLGSRAVKDAAITERQPLYRELMGKTFNLLIRLLGVRGIRDTQCGFKLLDGETARKLFADLTIDRFAWDVELVWLARRHGLRMQEVGVTWANSADSRVSPVRDSLSMFWDVLRFRLRHRRPSRRPQTPASARHNPDP
jgi:dolichyl-phosphate beta-glucosyltransferase